MNVHGSLNHCFETIRSSNHNWQNKVFDRRGVNHNVLALLEKMMVIIMRMRRRPYDKRMRKGEVVIIEELLKVRSKTFFLLKLVNREW